MSASDKITCIPTIVFGAKGLGPAQGRVLELLWSRADRAAWAMTAPALVWVGVGSLAATLNRPSKSVARAVAKLSVSPFISPLRDVKKGTVGWVRGELQELSCQCRASDASYCACRVLAPVARDDQGEIVPLADPSMTDAPASDVGTSTPQSGGGVPPKVGEGYPQKGGTTNQDLPSPNQNQPDERARRELDTDRAFSRFREERAARQARARGATTEVPDASQQD